MRPCYEDAMQEAQQTCMNLLESCFRGFIAAASAQQQTRKENPQLYKFFKQNVCDMLTCRSFHKLIPNLNAKRPNRFRVLYITFAVVAFLLLLSYYIVVLMTWMERKQQPDLK